MRKRNIKLKTPDGFVLDGEFTRVKDSTKGTIFAHGMTVARNDEGIFVRAEPKLNELEFSTLRFDFRAHGKSSGNSIKDFIISGEIKDLKTAVDFMLEQGIKTLNLAGASFGGSIASLYVGDNQYLIKSLFLANPVLNFDKGFLRPTTIWALKSFANLYDRLGKFGFIEVGSRKLKMGKALFDEMKIYNPCQALEKYNRPLMIVHGDKDDKVSLEQVIECFESLPGKKKKLEVIKGSDHGFHKEPYETQVVELLVNFFKDQV